MNKVFLIGNLTRDPELRHLPSGTSVADLRMAVNRKYRTANGENREDTCYVDVVVWGKGAETCNEYLRRGSQLLVEGRLHYDEWEKDGRKQSRLRVVTERWQFMDSPRRAEYDRDERTVPAAAENRAEPAAAGEDRGGDEDEAPAPGAADEDNLPF